MRLLPLLTLSDGTWEGVTLKPLNFEAQGASVASGYLHPLMKVREEFRLIFLELGYVVEVDGIGFTFGLDFFSEILIVVVVVVIVVVVVVVV
jgi:hypothetical protein